MVTRQQFLGFSIVMGISGAVLISTSLKQYKNILHSVMMKTSGTIVCFCMLQGFGGTVHSVSAGQLLLCGIGTK